MLDTVAKRKHSFPLNLKPRKSKQAKTLSLSEYNLVTKLLVWQIALLGRLHYSSAFVLLHLNYSSNCHLWMAAETCIAIPQLFAVIYSSDLNNTYMLCIAVSIWFQSSTQTTNTSLPLLCCYAEMPRQEQGYQEVLGRYLRQRQGRHQGGVECENRPRSRVSACRVSLSLCHRHDFELSLDWIL